MFHKNITKNKVRLTESSEQKNGLNNSIESIQQGINYYWAIKVIDLIPRHLLKKDITNSERVYAEIVNSERVYAELIKDIIKTLDLFIRDQFIHQDFKTHFDYVKEPKPSFCDYRDSIFDSTHTLLRTLCKTYYPSFCQFVDLFDTFNKLNSDKTVSRKNILREIFGKISEKINSPDGYDYKKYGYDQTVYNAWIARWIIFLNQIKAMIKEKQNQYSEKSRLFSSTPEPRPNTSSITSSGRKSVPICEVFSASTPVPKIVFRKIK
ncbi:MAG: hypothetical protein A3F12_04110 [Gammaproteobacteria bacterium RIFCSPHIGHO2_12_FULL_38_14]|nr:MAG: hypothetical protein A3F12_04110 [Gammaproteobacteria bacterium RIFCSPHIGHO2_12_FULL_38_14]